MLSFLFTSNQSILTDLSRLLHLEYLQIYQDYFVLVGQNYRKCYPLLCLFRVFFAGLFMTIPYPPWFIDLLPLNSFKGVPKNENQTCLLLGEAVLIYLKDQQEQRITVTEKEIHKKGKAISPELYSNKNENL